MQRNLFLSAASIVLTAFSLAGCASTSSNKPLIKQLATPDPIAPAILAAALPTQTGRTLPMFNAQGAPAAWSDMLALLTTADVILVGELHEVPRGQAFETALVEDLTKLTPNFCGALEFFERDDQVHIDDFLADITTPAQFEKATTRMAGSYTSGHIALIEACKAARRPLIAANAPRRYVRLARMKGYDSLGQLSTLQQTQFVIPPYLPTPDNRYYNDFVTLMAGKPEDRTSESQERASSMFRSQWMWDWTMADSVAALSRQGCKPIILFVGDFHTANAGGLTQALRHYLPAANIKTLSMVDASAAQLSPENANRADFIIHIATPPQ